MDQLQTAHARDRAGALAALEAPVTQSRFVDAARARALEKLGVSTVEGLLRHYPTRYLDLSCVASLRDVAPGTDATVVGCVHEIRVKRPRPRLTITEVAIVDGTGVLLGVWFNQPYIQRRYAVGDRVAFAGRVELDYGLKRIKAPFAELLTAEAEGDVVGRVLPVHRTTEGLSVAWLRRLVAAAVEDIGRELPDHLPARIRLKRGLLPLRSALASIHFPDSGATALAARKRLAYDELLLLQLYMAMRRHALTSERTGFAHTVRDAFTQRLAKAIPFSLTADQESAIAEILGDMAASKPMNRMLLGDVGTGKTLVAASALAAAADSGTQAAMMAPTEVLAAQYASALGPLCDAAGMPWALLTGSTPAAERRQVLARAASGELTVLFGTHALLEERVSFRQLTLAVVDEQHRFGVTQRLGLRGKGAAVDLLVMTATPIPRSLALTVYGDLDTSYLRQRPMGRPPVSTRMLATNQRGEAYDRVRAVVREGRQVYVVCALVEESEAAEARAATKEYERLGTTTFSDMRVGLLTGRMKPAEKSAVMARFRAGEIDVLVATTVIEVGVDVPNASLMIVENADRFGLAQLHQLRGRVGRGEHPGEVLLVANARTPEGASRMDAIVSTSDGFELAELDLKLRGEGSILGDRQHGLPALRLASVLTDSELISQAREDALELVGEDPHLSSPSNAPLRSEVKRVFSSAWQWVSSG